MHVIFVLQKNSRWPPNGQFLFKKAHFVTFYVGYCTLHRHLKLNTGNSQGLVHGLINSLCSQAFVVTIDLTTFCPRLYFCGLGLPIHLKHFHSQYAGKHHGLTMRRTIWPILINFSVIRCIGYNGTSDGNILTQRYWPGSMAGVGVLVLVLVAVLAAILAPKIYTYTWVEHTGMNLKMYFKQPSV